MKLVTGCLDVFKYLDLAGSNPGCCKTDQTNIRFHTANVEGRKDSLCNIVINLFCAKIYFKFRKYFSFTKFVKTEKKTIPKAELDTLQFYQFLAWKTLSRCRDSVVGMPSSDQKSTDPRESYRDAQLWPKVHRPDGELLGEHLCGCKGWWGPTETSW